MMAIKLKSIMLALVFLFAIIMFSPKILAADIFDGACNGATSSSSVCQQIKKQGTQNPVAGPNGIISKAANIIAIVAGVIAVIMIVISGFMFTTAGGSPVGQRSTDPNQLKKARATLFGSIVGLLVIALAWSITRFVTDHLIK